MTTSSIPPREDADTSAETVSVPENPTKAELRDSLEQAEFPAASRMAQEIFGREEE